MDPQAKHLCVVDIEQAKKRKPATISCWTCERPLPKNHEGRVQPQSYFGSDEEPWQRPDEEGERALVHVRMLLLHMGTMEAALAAQLTHLEIIEDPKRQAAYGLQSRKSVLGDAYGSCLLFIDLIKETRRTMERLIEWIDELMDEEEAH